MPTFQYKALQADGAIAEGVLDAPGRPDAFRQIEVLGLRPVSLAEKAAGTKNGNGAAAGLGDLGKISFNFKSKKVSAKDLENFTRLLSSLLAAGVPLSRALVILCKESSNPVAAAKWREIHDLVIDGMTLADAMAKSPDTFPRVYTAMVQAGETGGFLDVVLAQIADFQAREKELKSKVMTAILMLIAVSSFMPPRAASCPRHCSQLSRTMILTPIRRLMPIVAVRYLRRSSPHRRDSTLV